MPAERAITKHPSSKRCVTNSSRDGIVLWELQEQKCQQHVCQHLDVVQPTLAGWWLLILRWKTAKLPEKSALLRMEVLAAKTPKSFQFRTVDLTLFTNLVTLLVVACVTVVQTESQPEKKRQNKKANTRKTTTRLKRTLNWSIRQDRFHIYVLAINLVVNGKSLLSAKQY